MMSSSSLLVFKEFNRNQIVRLKNTNPKKKMKRFSENELDL